MRLAAPKQVGRTRGGRFSMRLAAVACALMIVMCVAVFGAILSQRTSMPIASTSPAQAATDGGAARAVVTTLEEQGAPAPTVTATKPAPAQLTPAQAVPV